jgi:catechol 2,3-dioxygenase-like lactoylglutathione lyase family enzyme
MRKLLAGVVITIVGISVFLISQASGRQNSSARPKISGIDHVRLYVSDMAKSRAFYGDVLGLPANVGNCVGDTHPCFAINAEQYVDLEPVPSPAPQSWLAEVAFATDDADGLRRFLVARGVHVGQVDTDGKASHFDMLDPQGSRISISFVQRRAPEGAFKASPKQLGSRMIHAGYVVRDRVAEDKFYRDILGFRTYWYGGFKDENIDWFELQVPDGNDWIEYMLNIPANADHKEMGEQNHFSLGVKDANVAAAEFKKRGWKKLDGPEVGRDGKNSIDAFDPDGTRVEVMEFAPRQTPCCHAYEAAHPTP